MLHFASKPDWVFTELLESGLEITIDTLSLEPEPWYSPISEEVANLFGGNAGVMKVLKELLAASREERIYEMNDYHMLLLHEILRGQCEIYNDQLRGWEEGQEWEPIRVNGQALRHIDEDELVGRFFPDTDFLWMPCPVDPQVPQEVLDVLGLRETTGGVLAKLKPHPEELKLTPLEGEPIWYDTEPSLPWWLELGEVVWEEDPPF